MAGLEGGAEGIGQQDGGLVSGLGAEESADLERPAAGWRSDTLFPFRGAATDLTGFGIKTAEGAELTVKLQDGKVWIVDAKGGTSMVTIANVNQSNGVIHVVDTVLMPAS